MHCIEKMNFPFKMDGKTEGYLSLYMFCQEVYMYQKISISRNIQTSFVPGKKALVFKSAFLFSEICFLRCQKKKMQLKAMYQDMFHGIILARTTLKHENHVGL